MKRLKNKILSMEPNTTTYKAMYEGSMTIIDPASTMPPYVDYSSTYYNENIGFDISTTHKLAQDKPTVVISIPCATLGIDIPDKSTESVEADFCLRAFKKYIIEKKINDMYERIGVEGIDFLYSPFFTTCERFLDLPRKQELMALINRMRKINMLKESDSI